MLQIKMNSGNGSIKIPLKKNIEESGNFGPQTPYSGDRWTPLLALSVFVSTFGFSVPAGFCLGVLNTPEKILKHWVNETMIKERHVQLSKAQFDILWSLIVSVFLIGGVIGGLTGAWFADRLGRRGTLIFGNVLNLVSSILFFASPLILSVESFFIARIIAGLIAGLMTTVVPMYLTELSPPKLTKLMGIFFPIGLTLGILIAQIMGLGFILGSTTRWPYLVSAYVLMTIMVFASLPWLPESPKYLHSICKEDEALHELSRLRALPTDMIAWEIRSAPSTPRSTNVETWNLLRVLTTPRLKIPTLLVIALQAGQQFSGINAIFYYSSNIFKTAGLEDEWIPYANIGTGFMNFLVASSGLLLVGSFGKKRLLIFSCTATSVTLVLLTFSSKYTSYASWVPKASVTLVLAFVFFYDLGLGPIPFFIGADLVDIGPRPTVMALGSVANWGSNFIVAAGYHSIHNWIHEFIFVLFAVCTGLLTILIVKCLPETPRTSSYHESISEDRHSNDE